MDTEERSNLVSSERFLPSIQVRSLVEACQSMMAMFIVEWSGTHYY